MVCKLKDVAEKLGISINTVSRALNDKSGMSDELKHKIKETAKELGYVHNMSASFLRTGRTNTIAIVYDNFFNPYYSIVTSILQREFSNKGYDVFIVSAKRRAVLDEETAQKIISRGVDAIVTFLEVNDNALKLIKKAKKEVLLIGRRSLNSANYLTFDDEYGSYLATKYLIECGHKDILYFSVRLRVSCAVDRLNGYKRAFKEANLEVKEENILYITDTCLNGSQFVLEAEKRNLKYTAILAFNDILAYGAIHELNNLGKKVPEDISVIGFDNVEENMFLPIGLTSINLDKEAICLETVNRVISALNKKKTKFNKLPIPNLVVRRTVKKI